jgi:hypothetical protein
VLIDGGFDERAVGDLATARLPASNIGGQPNGDSEEKGAVGTGLDVIELACRNPKDFLRRVVDRRARNAEPAKRSPDEVEMQNE